jgi:diguanylate cyclase (GGDEF)-like protein
MIEHSLAKQATLVGALREATALEYLTQLSFDAVPLNSTGPIDFYIPIVKDVRGWSRLFNLPILGLAPADDLAKCDEMYKTGITDALAKSYSCGELHVLVNILVHESRFRDSLKHISQETKHLATSDALTGLYSRGFLIEHLTTMVSDAGRTSQSFSLASMSIANVAEINSELGYAGGDCIIRQFGDVIGLLIRGEALAARYSGAKFIMTLTDTPAKRAKYAIQRITGVIGHTELALETHYARVKVELHTTLAGFENSDTVETLMPAAAAWTSRRRPDNHLPVRNQVSLSICLPRQEEDVPRPGGR